jgi:hypothetical protein
MKPGGLQGVMLNVKPAFAPYKKGERAEARSL